MTLSRTLAVVDAVAALYLLGWALRRERRDKPAVVAVGVVLAICAAFLFIVAAPADEPARQLPPLQPHGSLV